MKILIYIFDSYKNKSEILNTIENVIIIKKLKEDIEKLKLAILQTQPEMIIGIARSRVNYIEPVVVNRFNKDKKVSSDGKDQYELDLLKFESIKLNICKTPTHTFCNYVGYKVADWLARKELKTIKHSFLHLLDEERICSDFIKEIFS